MCVFVPLQSAHSKTKKSKIVLVLTETSIYMYSNIHVTSKKSYAYSSAFQAPRSRGSGTVSRGAASARGHSADVDM
jgi:hypothetical protein